jgi:hypothetical protein
MRFRPLVEPLPSDRPAPTPLFTRHMPGAIEGARDQRDQHRAAGAQSRGGRVLRAAMPRPDAMQARADTDRWADEGGSTDPEAVTRLRTTARR